METADLIKGIKSGDRVVLKELISLIQSRESQEKVFSNGILKELLDSFFFG